MKIVKIEEGYLLDGYFFETREEAERYMRKIKSNIFDDWYYKNHQLKVVAQIECPGYNIFTISRYKKDHSYNPRNVTSIPSYILYEWLNKNWKNLSKIMEKCEKSEK